MTDNKFNPKKKVRITPPQPFIAPPPQEFTEEVKKIADTEAKNQISKYLTQNQTGQNWLGTIAEISDDLTQAKAPDGSIYSATSIGAQPGKFAPFFKIDNSRGVIYVPEADTFFVDSNTKKGFVLQLGSDGVYLRELGAAISIKIKDVPANVLVPPAVLGDYVRQTDRVQALFSASCEHIMVGWWYQDQASPYKTYATYTIFKGFSLLKDTDPQGVESYRFTYDSTESNTVDLNALADNQAVPPLPEEEPAASYIWFYRPGLLVADYARFFPQIRGYYNTHVPPFNYYFTSPSDTFTQSQRGTFTQTWVLDPEHVPAVFNNVKFAFNNDEQGNPIVDIVAAFKGVTIGYLESLTTLDEQTCSYTYANNLINPGQPGFGSSSTINSLWSQNQEGVKFSYEWDPEFAWVPPGPGRFGRGYVDYTYEDLTDYDLTYLVTEGNDNYGTCSGAGRQIMTFKGGYDNGSGCGYDLHVTVREESGCGYVALNSAICNYLGQCTYLPFQFGFQTTTNVFTTYDGVTKDVPDDIPNPQSFWYGTVRQCSLQAGYYINYYWYAYSPASFFLNAYYFVRAQMYLKNVNGEMQKIFVGRPPTIQNDYDLMSGLFRGISPDTTAYVYEQTASLYEVGRTDPIDDASFQALLEILREVGLGAVADFLESEADAIGQYLTKTNDVFWYGGAYGADPFYGYLKGPDVFSDRIFSAPETWPYQSTYRKAVDSFEVINYDQNNGAELIFLVNVAETGEVSLGAIANKVLKDNSGMTLLDVGMSYGPRSN